MAESLVDRQFNAAVNIIQNLPKNGSFKPSHELMLRFYSYYKQATLGDCNAQKPSFWDVVGKAKWEAWTSLKGTSPEEAKRGYVEQMKEIIETMPQTDEVSEMLDILGPFYELVDIKTGLPVPAGEAMNYKSPVENGSCPPTPEKLVPNGDVQHSGDLSGIPTNTMTKSTEHMSNGSEMDTAPSIANIPTDAVTAASHLDSDTESEVFVDTSDIMPQSAQLLQSTISNGPHSVLLNGDHADSRVMFPPIEDDCHVTGRPVGVENSQVTEQLRLALIRMNSELESINKRVDTLEKITVNERRKQLDRSSPKWWPFEFINPQTAALIFLWPIGVVWLMNYLKRRRR